MQNCSVVAGVTICLERWLDSYWGPFSPSIVCFVISPPHTVSPYTTSSSLCSRWLCLAWTRTQHFTSAWLLFKFHLQQYLTLPWILPTVTLGTKIFHLKTIFANNHNLPCLITINLKIRYLNRLWSCFTVEMLIEFMGSFFSPSGGVSKKIAAQFSSYHIF